MKRELLTSIKIKETFKKAVFSIDEMSASVYGKVTFCNFIVSKYLYDMVFYEAKVRFESYLDRNVDNIDRHRSTFAFDVYFSDCMFDEKIKDSTIIERISIQKSIGNLRFFSIYDGDCEFPGIPMVCPENGEFIGYKAVLLPDLKRRISKRAILKLLIPDDAKRSSGRTNKCRCSKAKAIELYSIEDLSPITKDDRMEIISFFNNTFKYEIGEMAYPDGFEENRWIECGNGIHFFMTANEAIDYALS